MPKQNDLPSPVTYSQKFYAKAAGMDVDLPEAITPEQKYLQAIAERGESIGNIGDVEIDNPENGEVMKYDAEQGKWINGTASGGGGTSDYTDLTNKPKINNVTLAGNKSLYDIGAAAADETYTDAEVDALLSEKADADDVYTIAQVDAELAKKVDKVSGKGLSANDFTNADKANLATALEKANAAAPQSTTYTKDEVNTALAAKLNKADVDDALSSTSTNPVQNKVLTGQIGGLVDRGAKNIANMDLSTYQTQSYGSGSTVVTVARNGDEFTINGTMPNEGVFFNIYFKSTNDVLIPTGNYVASLSGAETNNNIIIQVACPTLIDNGGITPYRFTIPNGTTGSWLRVYLNANSNFNNVKFKLMICTAEDWAVSHKFVPYVPTNRELYEMSQRKKSIRHNFTTSDYEEIPECSVTVPPNKMALIVASLKWNNSYPRGIKMSTGSISQSDRIFGIAESENNYAGITAHGLLTNTNTDETTVQIYAKSASAGGNDVNIVYWIL